MKVACIDSRPDLRTAVLFGISVFFLLPAIAAASPHEYVGAGKCSLCHKTAAQGEQSKIWQNSKHAKAYEMLGTPEAKAAAAKMGVENPQTSGKCLKCHSTAYDHSENQVTTAVPVEEGVSCESCHGSGKDYMKLSVMKDREAAKAAGLLIPDETSCKKCHNEESPTYKPFDYQKYWDQIKHPKP